MSQYIGLKSFQCQVCKKCAHIKCVQMLNLLIFGLNATATSARNVLRNCQNTYMSQNLNNLLFRSYDDPVKSCTTSPALPYKKTTEKLPNFIHKIACFKVIIECKRVIDNYTLT